MIYCSYGRQATQPKRHRKEANQMPTAQENLDIKKAMAYDLLIIFKGEDSKTYTPEEVEKIIQAYIAGLAQK